MRKERTQTIILSILVILSIILTQQIWLDSPSSSLQSEANNLAVRQEEVQEKRNTLVAPERILIGFGGDSFSSASISNYYTFLKGIEMGEGWEVVQTLLLDFFTGPVQVVPVDAVEYRIHQQAQFIELEFGEGISAMMISMIFGANDSAVTRNINEISKILVPANNQGSIYIVGEENTVYEATLDNYSNTTLKAYVDAYDKKDFVKYYSLFANFVDNTTLVPLNYSTIVPQHYAESEIDVSNEALVIDSIKSFFNQNFDFVKTIKETSGAVVYLYDYGQKSVRISNRGRLEYNEQISKASSTNVVESLDAAVAFVMEHGGFPEGAYLSEVKPITNQQDKGYYFGFSYDFEGYPIHFTGNNMQHPIEVEVYGDRIKTYRRFVRTKMNLSSFSGSIISPHTIIEQNMSVLMEYYLTDHPAEAEQTVKTDQTEEMQIYQNLESVELVYYDKGEVKDRELILPSWKININNRVYYFDGYGGALLYSSRLN